MSEDCRYCDHPVGVHHAGTVDEKLCAVKGCECIGYIAPKRDRIDQ